MAPRLYAYILAGDLPHGTICDWPGMFSSVTWEGANALRCSRFKRSKKRVLNPKEDPVAILRVEVRPGEKTGRVMGRVNGPNNWTTLLGCIYRGTFGKVYRADLFDYSSGPCGFRMVEVDPETFEDIEGAEPRDISERAIDRTFHRLWPPYELLSVEQVSALLYPKE